MAADGSLLLYTRTFAIYLCLVIFGLLNMYASADIKEYCNVERFRASCSSDEVIVMEEALFGRMHIGKCIEQDLGFLGCSSNVKSHFDRVCSNKNTCEVDVSPIDIPTPTTASACPKDVSRYLEAGFSCQKVLQFQCSDADILIADDTMLSSSDLLGCGSSLHTIRAHPGQQLNISIIDFTWDESSTSNCRQHYGSIKDSISSNSAQICSGRERRRHVMVSNGNSIEIQITNGASTPSFLFVISLLGCGDIDAPTGGWVQREGDELIMGCHSGKHTWTLQCVGNQWQGVTGQCGTDIAMAISKPKKASKSLWSLSPGILVFAACSMLLFLSAVIFTIGVCIYVNRSKARPDTSKYIIYEEQNQLITTQPNYFGTQRPHQKTEPFLTQTAR